MAKANVVINGLRSALALILAGIVTFALGEFWGYVWRRLNNLMIEKPPVLEWLLLLVLVFMILTLGIAFGIMGGLIAPNQKKLQIVAGGVFVFLLLAPYVLIEGLFAWVMLVPIAIAAALSSAGVYQGLRFLERLVPRR